MGTTAPASEKAGLVQGAVLPQLEQGITPRHSKGWRIDSVTTRNNTTSCQVTAGGATYDYIVDANGDIKVGEHPYPCPSDEA